MLAIVIPYYKLTFFEETLLSLAGQTDKRFKVYIGDDASPENTEFLLKKINGQFDFRYHRFESNLGKISLTKHWERCIDLIGDEKWIMVLGDDDVLGKNVVKELYDFIGNKQIQIDLIRFNLKIIGSTGEISKDHYFSKVHENTNDLLDRIFSIKETITASEFVFSRSIYNKNNGFVEFPLAWFSDYATWLLYSKKNGVYNIHNESVYWRLSEINISSKSSNIEEVEFKVQSLFLFMSFLQNHFTIEKRKQKKFVFVHLESLLREVKFFKFCAILRKSLFKYEFKFSEIIILNFVFNNIGRKAIKRYGHICTPSKG